MLTLPMIISPIINIILILIPGSNQPPDSLFMMHGEKKIYFIHDTVHLAKNVRNNLLNYKRFLFPAFKIDDFEDAIVVPGGSVYWKETPRRS